MKSIIQEEQVCYECGTTQNLHEHHIFAGNYRKRSEQHGIKVWLCMNHHTGAEGVHTGNNELDLRLKKKAQSVFEETHTREEFLKIFKGYL